MRRSSQRLNWGPPGLVFTGSRLGLPNRSCVSSEYAVRHRDHSSARENALVHRQTMVTLGG